MKIAQLALPRQELHLGSCAGSVERQLESWEEEGFAQGLWRRESRLWSAEPVPELVDRLGWLQLPETMVAEIDDLVALAEVVAGEGVTRVILLGMGGSSLAPKVFHRILGGKPEFPALEVLDSPHPAAVDGVARRLDPASTLFVVSSKSGTTIETVSLFRYFWQLLGEKVAEPGQHFLAISDAGTPLEQLGRKHQFRRVVRAPADVGGRFSALSHFGLLPAALVGVDIARLLERARAMAAACGPQIPCSESPGLRLGAALGVLATQGRDKLSLLTSPGLASFSVWLEQLVAESTGKQGRGILPVTLEPASRSPGDDGFVVGLMLEDEVGSELDRRLEELAAGGLPVARIVLGDRYDLGAEIFRWEVAVAAAGSILSVQPFSQPDVQLSKDLTQQILDSELPTAPNSVGLTEVSASGGIELGRAVSRWLAERRERGYVAIQAFLAPSPEMDLALERLRHALQLATDQTVTLEYGPRFLHSTGQLHKGGADTGLFLQLVDQFQFDLPVPETDYTFGGLVAAQAIGDAQALIERGRRVLRVALGTEVIEGLDRLGEQLDV